VKKLLFAASAPVDAPLDRVLALIDSGWVIDQIVGPGGREYVDVDHGNGVAGVQGHWWYRGEITAAESGGRTVVSYSIYNIASRAAWAVPLANKLFIGYQKTVDAAAAGIAAAIERELGE
jgi:hypothetical protein